MQVRQHPLRLPPLLRLLPPDRATNDRRAIERAVMPKMKSKSGAKKRFKARGSGSIKRSMAFKRHILTKKTTKNKRQLRGTAEIHSTNLASVKSMLPYI